MELPEQLRTGVGGGGAKKPTRVPFKHKPLYFHSTFVISHETLATLLAVVSVARSGDDLTAVFQGGMNIVSLWAVSHCRPPPPTLPVLPSPTEAELL